MHHSTLLIPIYRRAADNKSISQHIFLFVSGKKKGREMIKVTGLMQVLDKTEQALLMPVFVAVDLPCFVVLKTMLLT